MRCRLAYIEGPLKKLITMAISQFKLVRWPFLCVLALSICLCHITPAWSAEDVKPESPVPLDKLHSFTNRASELALQAMGLIGIRYQFGGNSPDSGLDCSGFVRHVFKEAWGAILPRTSLEISHVGEKIDPKDLQPGDLVFYNTLKKSFSHVGIYLGNNQFIHSPSVGGQIRIENMDMAYWKNHFSGARRIDDPEQK